MSVTFCSQEHVARRSPPPLSTDALKSAQKPVTAVFLGEIMGNSQHQTYLSLAPGADLSASALSDGLAPEGPSGVLHVGSAERAGLRGDPGPPAMRMPTGRRGTTQG